jgi:phosphoglycerol transferase
MVSVQAPQFILRQIEAPSQFYEEHYIDPKTVDFIFPEKKRNLLVIVVESLETSFLQQQFCAEGLFEEDLIPEIAALAREGVNFSGTEDIGGLVQVSGTSWTIAGIVSFYSGLSLVLPIDGNTYRGLGNTFFSNAACLGDILYEEGYRNYFICGSDSAFAGRDVYFKLHGNTTIWDYHYFRDNGYIPPDYLAWWGFEDRKLYSFAKEKLSALGGRPEPFFFTLLTADTHASDGYLDDHAERLYDSQYKNVLRDTSRQLDDFMLWIKEQPFYEHTTVAILGDHLYMDATFFPAGSDLSRRHPLNIFINSPLSDAHAKNRIFSHLDIFPTLLDSIGVDYNAEGLGLGRRMSMGTATLTETISWTELNAQLVRRSKKYRSLFSASDTSAR